MENESEKPFLISNFTKKVIFGQKWTFLALFGQIFQK